VKKRVLIGLALALALGLPLAGLVWATAGSVTVVSATNTKVYWPNVWVSGYPATPATGLPSGWNSHPTFDDSTWDPAALYQHLAYLEPTNTPPFNATGAKWISINGSGAGPDFNTATGPRGVYLYRKTFQVPATAYNLSGEAAIAADNYGWLYLNGNQVLEPVNKTQYDRDFLASVGPSTGAIAPSALSCDNVLAAEVQNGNCSLTSTGVYCPDGANGPTGVVFSLSLDYEVPDVVWQPPVTNLDFELKDGTTLPLKFKLYTQAGDLLTDMQDIYMTVHGPSPDGLGPEIVRWALGDGIDSLRWSGADEYYYIANFQTRDYTLAEGETYTAVVHDGCTDDILGSTSFQLNVKAGRGNSGK